MHMFMKKIDLFYIMFFFMHQWSTFLLGALQAILFLLGLGSFFPQAFFLPTKVDVYILCF